MGGSRRTRLESPAVASSWPSRENSMLDSTSEPVAGRLLLGAQSRRARGTRRAGMGSGRSHQSGLKCHSAGSWRLGLHAAGQGSVPAARGVQAACAHGGCSPGCLPSWSLPAKLQAMLESACQAAGHAVLCWGARLLHPVPLLVPGSSAATRLLQAGLFREALLRATAQHVQFAARSPALVGRSEADNAGNQLLAMHSTCLS